MYTEDNWRDGLQSFPSYKKRFAFWPVRTSDGQKIWFKNFYKKYLNYHANHYAGDHCHPDMVEIVSEETYIIQRLSENF